MFDRLAELSCGNSERELIGLMFLKYILFKENSFNDSLVVMAPSIFLDTYLFEN